MREDINLLTLGYARRCVDLGIEVSHQGGAAQ